MFTVHNFPTESSGTVYDLTQTSENIKSGDVLVIPNEEIVAIFNRAWPTAITTNNGELHTPDDGGKELRKDFPEALREAEKIAVDNGWRMVIDPPF